MKKEQLPNSRKHLTSRCGKVLFQQTLDNPDLFMYEFTVTLDRKKWSLTKAETSGCEILKNFLSKKDTDIHSWGLTQELHPGTDWPHWHGFITFTKRRNNRLWVLKKLKMVFGRSTVVPSRDYPEYDWKDCKKIYGSWYEYITKEGGDLFLSSNYECKGTCLNEWFNQENIII